MILGIDATQANREMRSGTEWYAFYLLQEFKKLLKDRRDVAVRLYTKCPLQTDMASDLPKNFEVHILRWPLKYFWAQGRLSLEMIIHPPDVLFSPAHTIPLVHPRKTFTTLHDVGFADNPELYDRPSFWYHQFSARLAVQKAWHIFTVSEFSKQRILKNYACDPQKITVTHLGFDPRKFAKLSEDNIKTVLAKYNLAYKNYILFIGRMEPKKNILRILESFKIAHTDLALVLAGRKVRTDDVDAYLQLNPKLSSQVKFLGYFEEADKPALYQGAKLFLFPTLYEGFGMPIIEAQVSGIPVITSTTASNVEVAGKGAMLVDPRNPQEIADAICSVLENPDLRKQIITAGQQNIFRFNWRETASKTLETILG